MNPYKTTHPLFINSIPMASLSSTYLHVNLPINPLSLNLSSPSILSFPFPFPFPRRTSNKLQIRALKLSPDGIRTCRSSSRRDTSRTGAFRKSGSPQLDAGAGEYRTVDSNDENETVDEGGFDWEDQILEDTVPLVGFVRMLLHSDKYKSGERLSPEHERIILDRLLPYHPECEKKIGRGINYITVGYHPDFESSRCLFIVRKNGELEDFSYWKCIKGLVKKKFPLYADSFIQKHFRKRRQYDL